MTIPVKRSPAELRPLLFGRMTRVVFGILTLVLIPVIGADTLTPMGTGGLLFLGISFLVGGLMGNPGCEITSIPNLVLPQKKRVHCL